MSGVSQISELDIEVFKSVLADGVEFLTTLEILGECKVWVDKILLVHFIEAWSDAFFESLPYPKFIIKCLDFSSTIWLNHLESNISGIL